MSVVNVHVFHISIIRDCGIVEGKDNVVDVPSLHDLCFLLK